MTIFYCFVAQVNVSTASEYYYFFKGYQTGTMVEGNFEMWEWGDGQRIDYLFAVDFDASGTQTLNDGTVTVLNDTSIANYFYADWWGSDYLPASPGMYTEDHHVAEYNWGYDYGGGSEDMGVLLGGAQNNAITVNSGVNFVSDWLPYSDWEYVINNPASLGDVPQESLMAGYEPGVFTYNSVGDNFSTGTVILAEVRNSFFQIIDPRTDPNHPAYVPIPSAVWLLGSGLLGIVGIRRKFKK